MAATFVQAAGVHSLAYSLLNLLLEGLHIRIPNMHIYVAESYQEVTLLSSVEV